MSAIRLLTFDLDDTLWDLRPVLLRAEARAFAWLCEHAPLLARQHDVDSLRAARIALATQRPELRHRISELRLQSQRDALILAGYPREKAEHLSAQAFEVFVAARHEISFFESALETLTLLHRDYLLAAVTNGNASPARLGLDHLFAFTVSSEHLPAAKPAPEPFVAALQRADCAPTAAIHIGDHIEHDIRGAQAVGMHTIWVNQQGEEWPGADAPDAIVRHLAELPDAVRAIAART